MNRNLYLISSERNIADIKQDWTAKVNKQMTDFIATFNLRRVVNVPSGDKATPEYLNSFMKDADFKNGDAAILTGSVLRDSYLLHGICFRLQSKGVDIYDMEQKQIRKYSIPEIIQHKDDPEKHNRAILFISEKIPPKLWSQKKLQSLNEYQWTKRAWIQTSEHLGRDVAPSNEPERLVQDAAELGRHLGHNTTIDFGKSTFVLDPEADAIFNESVAIEIMNRGGTVTDIRYDKEADMVVIKTLETEIETEERAISEKSSTHYFENEEMPSEEYEDDNEIEEDGKEYDEEI